MPGEVQQAKEKFRVELVRLSKKITEQKEGRAPDLSMVPPHKMGRR